MKSCRHSDTRMLDESEYLADLPAEVCEFCRLVAHILRRSAQGESGTMSPDRASTDKAGDDSDGVSPCG